MIRILPLLGVCILLGPYSCWRHWYSYEESIFSTYMGSMFSFIGISSSGIFFITWLFSRTNASTSDGSIDNDLFFRLLHQYGYSFGRPIHITFQFLSNLLPPNYNATLNSFLSSSTIVNDSKIYAFIVRKVFFLIWMSWYLLNYQVQLGPDCIQIPLMTDKPPIAWLVNTHDTFYSRKADSIKL